MKWWVIKLVLFICAQPKLLLIILFILAIKFILILSLLLFIKQFEVDFWRTAVDKDTQLRDMVACDLSPIIDLGKLAADLSKEIKDPLTSLCIILNLLEDPKILGDPKLYQKYLAQAEAIILLIIYLSDFLHQQLAISNEAKLFDLCQTIQDLFHLYKVYCQRHHIQAIIVSDREYRLFTDQAHLLRVLNIIILNAMEALALSHKKHRHLSISCYKTAYLLHIVKKDNADGIDRDKKSDLLKRICYVNQETGGLGIGLYFANLLMKKFYGTRIKIKSSRKHGTQVILKIKKASIMSEHRTNDWQKKVVSKPIV